jgi:hypothetical protein
MALPTSPFDATKSIYAGKSVIAFRPTSLKYTGCTGQATGDTITKAAHGYQDGDTVVFVSGTGFTGLTAGNIYFVRDRATDTFKLAATSGGAAIDITVDGTVGVFHLTHIFESRLLESKLDQEEKAIEMPDSSGILRKVRTMLSKQQENFTFESPQPKRLLKIFSSALGGRVAGTCTLWIPDPDDASGYVSLKSEADFAATVTRDGNIKFGDSDFSKVTLNIESNKQGAITWTADASA